MVVDQQERMMQLKTHLPHLISPSPRHWIELLSLFNTDKRILEVLSLGAHHQLIPHSLHIVDYVIHSLYFLHSKLSALAFLSDTMQTSDWVLLIGAHFVGQKERMCAFMTLVAAGVKNWEFPALEIIFHGKFLVHAHFVANIAVSLSFEFLLDLIRMTDANATAIVLHSSNIFNLTPDERMICTQLARELSSKTFRFLAPKLLIDLRRPETSDIAPESFRQDQCVVCFIHRKEFAFECCGHMCVCIHCASAVKSFQCVICRQVSKRLVHIFW
jgi:hypothetical protein